ncbi:miraculin-like [Prosopis cineraria]|uniref:miraculin-like n=1 Tax=Prosopis cineraria TaxID=364024 RepID=UPI00240F393C|nr:miraculin-like [Prosopis cineraria]
MKITLAAFVLLVALSTRPLLGAADAAPDQVIDTSGKKLQAGVRYIVLPAPQPPGGGGLALASIGEKCPLDVVAVLGDPGLGVSFTPVNSKKGRIRVSTDLNVMFSANTDCPQSNVWKLDDYDNTTGQWFVTTGGVVGNPGRQTVRDWFKIEKYEESYKFVYCPSVCTNCKVLCKDIGIYADSHGNRRLALSDTPFKVQFLCCL